MDKLKQNAANWHGKLVKELYLAIGIARAEDHPELSAEKLMIKADMAMYNEKDAFYRRAKIASEQS